MATWVLLAALAGGIWYFFLRPRAREETASTPPAASAAAGPFEEAPRAAEVQLSEDERHAQEAAASAAKWQAERRSVEERHREAMQPIKEKLHKAQKLVKDSGVGDAACSVLRDTWHWPSWSQRDDWKAPVDIEGFTGQAAEWNEKEGHKASWIGWTNAGSSYRLTHIIPRSYGSSSSTLAKLALSVDDAEVMILDISNKLEDEYDRWNVFGVSAFKAGPWMAHLNELAGRLLIARHESYRAHELSFQGEKAAKIEL